MSEILFLRRNNISSVAFMAASIRFIVGTTVIRLVARRPWKINHPIRPGYRIVFLMIFVSVEGKASKSWLIKDTKVWGLVSGVVVSVLCADPGAPITAVGRPIGALEGRLARSGGWPDHTILNIRRKFYT
jgi:hypothetical protein